MNTTLTHKKSRLVLGLASVAALVATVITPTAQAATTYAIPAAPTNVVAYESARGITVKWTPSVDVAPQITSYIISAGPGSCPIVVSASARSIVTLPVLAGQKVFTPVVQAPEKPWFVSCRM